MSLQALSAALSSRIDELGLSCAQRFILFLLGNWANEDDVAFPSIRMLTRKTGLSERGVQVAINHLIKFGLVERIERAVPGERQKSNFYRLSFVETAATPALSAPISPHSVHPTPALSAPLTTLDTKIDTTDADASGAGARAAAFDRLRSGWARVSPGRLAPRMAEAAFEAACERCEPDRLADAGLRYLAEDPDVKRLGTAIRLDRWLDEARFVGWLTSAGDPPPRSVSAARRWSGPEKIRDVLTEVAGAPFVASYLDPAEWDASTNAIRAATGIGLGALQQFRLLLSRHGVERIEKRASQSGG